VINSKWCTLNIGQNFAVTSDGTLYANGASLSGYATVENLTSVETDVNDINTKINSWTNQYGIIAKYKEESGIAYFVAGIKSGATSIQVVEKKADIVNNKDKTIYYVKNSNESYYGYLDDETDTYYLEKTSEIKFFSVPTTGLFYASNGVISGTIYATNGWFNGGIAASEGDIGGWKIKPGYLIH
jgi:hypothetical protein